MQGMEEEIMEVLEVTGTSYPDARELPNKTGRPVAKHQKSSSSTSGKTPALPSGAVQQLLSQLRKEDHKITEANKMVMWLVNGKRKFVRASEYERLRAES